MTATGETEKKNRAEPTARAGKGTRSREVEASLALLGQLLSGYQPRNFNVRFWDGSTWEPELGHEARFTLILRHPGSLRAMFWPPGELTFAGACLYDNFDVEGELEAVFPLAGQLLVDQRLGAASSGATRFGTPATLGGGGGGNPSRLCAQSEVIPEPLD